MSSSFRSDPLEPWQHNLLDDELYDREQVVWTGRPIARRFAWASLPIVLFAIPWTAFSIFWMVMAGMIGAFDSEEPSGDGVEQAAPAEGVKASEAEPRNSGTDTEAGGGQLETPEEFDGGLELFENFFWMFGIPFFLIGVGMLSSPLLAVMAGKKTFYVVTDQRAIIFSGGRQLKVRSYRSDDLSELSRTQKRDGTGSIHFSDDDGTYVTTHRGNLNTSKPRRNRRGFEHIHNPRDVERLLEALRSKREVARP